MKMNEMSDIRKHISQFGESVKSALLVEDAMNLKATKTLLTVDQSDEINGKWNIVFIGYDVIVTTKTSLITLFIWI